MSKTVNLQDKKLNKEYKNSRFAISKPVPRFELADQLLLMFLRDVVVYRDIMFLTDSIDNYVIIINVIPIMEQDG